MAKESKTAKAVKEKVTSTAKNVKAKAETEEIKLADKVQEVVATIKEEVKPAKTAATKKAAAPRAVHKAAPAEVKAEEPKKEAKVPVKKTAAKKTPAKKAPVSAVKPEPVVVVQSLDGGEANMKDILAKVEQAAAGAQITAVYVKPGENRAYFVAGDITGSVTLWD